MSLRGITFEVTPPLTRYGKVYSVKSRLFKNFEEKCDLLSNTECIYFYNRKDEAEVTAIKKMNRN